MIFDLWDTLALWPVEAGQELHRRWARRLSLEPDEFETRWRESYGLRHRGTLADAFRLLCEDEETIAELVEWRDELTRRSLVPRDGALETLRELHGRGLRVGLVSACTEDVPRLWPESPFADLVEEPVFSCEVGVSKPEPQIYLAACERLDVGPGDCLFVGDGANDELAGAQRVGMRAVCVLPPGRAEPLWPEARGWKPTISSLHDVLSLV